MCEIEYGMSGGIILEWWIVGFWDRKWKWLIIRGYVWFVGVFVLGYGGVGVW